jgi:WD40 repeat protein
VWTDATLRGPVLAMAWSKDGSQLVLGSGGKAARIVDATNGKPKGDLTGASSPATAVAISPDGKQVAVGENAMAVHLFAAATGKMEREFPHPDSVSGLVFSPDGARLAAAGSSSTGAVYTVADGKRVWDFQGRSAAFSTDGKLLITAVPAGSLRLFDAETGKPKGEVKTGKHQPWLSASSDLKSIVTWNPADPELHVFDGLALKELGLLKGHEKGVFSAAITPDGAHAASSSEDHTLRLWDVANRRSAGHMVLENIPQALLAFSPDGRRLAVAQGNRVSVYQVAW